MTLHRVVKKRSGLWIPRGGLSGFKGVQYHTIRNYETSFKKTSICCVLSRER